MSERAQKNRKDGEEWDRVESIQERGRRREASKEKAGRRLGELRPHRLHPGSAPTARAASSKALELSGPQVCICRPPCLGRARNFLRKGSYFRLSSHSRPPPLGRAGAEL